MCVCAMLRVTRSLPAPSVLARTMASTPLSVRDPPGFPTLDEVYAKMGRNIAVRGALVLAEGAFCFFCSSHTPPGTACAVNKKLFLLPHLALTLP